MDYPIVKVRLHHKLILVCCLLSVAILSEASHMIAVEIRARPVDCKNRVYEITLIGYVNTSSTVVFGGDPASLSFGDGESIVVPEQQHTLIDPILNVGRVQFTVRHTYAATGKYVLSYIEHARNDGIVNMDQSGLTTFYTETAITIVAGSCDASSYLTVPPVDRACSGIAYYHNPGAIDTDDDSLSFSLVTPKSLPDTEVINYAYPNDRKFYNIQFNYNQANEAKTGPPNFIIDPVDGTLTWDAPGLAGEYALAIKVTSWKFDPATNSWAQSGYSIRDMQVVVQDCDNKRPDIITPEALCVVAGETVEFSVPGSDPNGDPVIIEAFSDILNLPIDAGELIPDGNPQQSTTAPFDTAHVRFKWTTSCINIKNQPYKVVFKITDVPPAGPRLVRFKTVSIKVTGPAPEFESVSVNPIAKTISLSWEPYPCENVEEIQVWRRVSKYEYDQPECHNGMPYFLRYKLMATLPGDAQNYLDNDLSVGAEYCYRIVALNGSSKIPSRISLDTCIIPRPAEAPIITNVSVIKTHDINGEILVRWTSPFEIDEIQYPPPYGYKLFRSTDDNSFLEVADIPTGDTSFVDSGLNTEAAPYTYRVELYVPAITTNPVDTSSNAGSVFLNSSSRRGGVSLSWSANTPWYNYTQRYPYHLVYRSEAGPDGPFILIDSVDVNEYGFHYIDSGQFQAQSLIDNKLYHYQIMTRGAYGNPGIVEPLENLSQVVGAITLDNTPPCVPVVAIEPIDCASFECALPSYFNQITWSFDNTSCVEAGLTYRIYTSQTDDGSFDPLIDLSGTSFKHTNLSSMAICYRIAAIDAAGNISAMSEPVCNENCPYFELPNVFTPGTGDDLNNEFRAFGPQTGTSRCWRFVVTVDLKVYNRWGEEIYSITAVDPTTDSILWDGSSNRAKDAEPGIYFYSANVTFDVRDPARRQRHYKGWVQLIRND